jgi:hypothetical protein
MQKLPTRFVIYAAVQNYLDDQQLELLKKDLGEKPLNNPGFFKLIRKHFDVERLRAQPFFWQDIWIYNYLMYDMQKGRKVLLNKYIKEIIEPQQQGYKQLKELLSAQG